MLVSPPRLSLNPVATDSGLAIFANLGGGSDFPRQETCKRIQGATWGLSLDLSQTQEELEQSGSPKQSNSEISSDLTLKISVMNF